MAETCSTCRFNQANTCRRFPPVQFREERMGHYDRYVVDVWQQPYISDTDWCGEWKAREGAKVESVKPITSLAVKPDSNTQIMNATPPSEGWIPWAGGECPVSDDTVVSVKFREGRVSKAYDRPSDWSWTHGGPDDILAYRVVKPADFRLEAGKYYITATGERVGPMKEFMNVRFIAKEGDGRVWWIDGVWAHLSDKGPDIVALAADQGEA